MKKIVVIFITLAIVICSFTGCSENIQTDSTDKIKTSAFTPKYIDFILPMCNIDGNETKEVPKGTSPSKEQQKKFEDLFFKLSEFYKIKKNVPKFEFLTAEQFESYANSKMLKAFYDFETKKIYLAKNLDLALVENKEIFVHECLHYLSDNMQKSKRGLIFFKDNKEYNRILNEGVTELLATKFLNQNIDSPYEFAETLVKQLSICVGFDTVKEAYFKSDDTKIRKIFNECVSDIYPSIENEGIIFDQYDSLGCSCFTMWAYSLKDQYQMSCLSFTALEEQLLYFAQKQKKSDECKLALSKLLDEYYTKEEQQVLFDITYLKNI